MLLQLCNNAACANLMPVSSHSMVAVCANQYLVGSVEACAGELTLLLQYKVRIVWSDSSFWSQILSDRWSDVSASLNWCVRAAAFAYCHPLNNVVAVGVDVWLLGRASVNKVQCVGQGEAAADGVSWMVLYWANLRLESSHTSYFNCDCGGP
jgi:hypothetical protein